MKPKYKFLSVCLLGSLLCFANIRLSHAVVATEATQLLIYVQNLLSVAKQAQMELNQLQMIQNQLKSLKTYNAGEWGDILNIIRRLESLVQEGKGISYRLKNVEEVFKSKFPGYQPVDDYAKEYQEWSQTTMDSIRSSLSTAGVQNNEFESQANLLKRLSVLSDSAQGQTQAIQVSTMVSNQIVQQLMLLRQLNMSQIQAQNVYMAHEINRQAVGEAAADSFFRQVPYQKGISKKY